MAQDYILAIDQGTTGSTVLVFDQEASIRGHAYSEFTQYYPQPGWVEHDADEIWSVTLKVIGTALNNARITPGDIRGIGITNQRETSLLWHRNNSNPTSRAIVWQDRRTSSLCDELRNEGLEPLWQQKTGLLLDPYFSGTKVKWMLDNIPGLREKAIHGEIAFGTIDSWLTWKLTGGVRHTTDHSNASRTLLYNIHKLDWDDEILARLDIPREILPEVKPSSCIFGETDPRVFFGKRVPVAGVAGDQQSALFGQACYRKGFAKNTYGTGSFLLMNTGRKPIASRKRLLTTIACRVGEEPVEYALEGAIFVTGAAIQWLRDGLKIISTAAESESLARSVAENDDVYFVPALTGLGAPYWDSYARGTIVGLTRGTTAAHIARAALESICYQTRDVVEAMQTDSGIKLSELRVDGGAVGNSFLMQFQADILGVPVEVPATPETTALGAAYLAGLATGLWKSRDELGKKHRTARHYEPAMDTARRDQLYSRWQQAVQRSRGWSKT